MLEIRAASASAGLAGDEVDRGVAADDLAKTAALAFLGIDGLEADFLGQRCVEAHALAEAATLAAAAS